ncbi:hypothetical protein N7526_010117 [Penicillium atrosanguineum]|nr:hypothetical protein N7526_010117 [Penicillium atrosanguineum]
MGGGSEDDDGGGGNDDGNGETSYADDDVYNDPHIFCHPPCLTVLPFGTLLEITTISFPPYTTSVDVGDGTNTITVSFYNVLIFSSENNATVPRYPSIDVEPEMITLRLITDEKKTTTSNELILSPWPRITECLLGRTSIVFLTFVQQPVALEYASGRDDGNNILSGQITALNEPVFGRGYYHIRPIYVLVIHINVDSIRQCSYLGNQLSNVRAIRFASKNTTIMLRPEKQNATVFDQYAVLARRENRVRNYVNIAGLTMTLLHRMATDTDARKSPDAAQGRIAIDHSTEQCGQRSVHRNDRSQNDDDENASLYSGIIPTGSLFGASSGAHILHEVGTVTGPRSAFANKRQQTSQTLPHNKLPKLQRQASQRDYSDVQFVIPTRKVADHLLNIYWDYVDSAYPWLDRSSIESAYETLWIKDGQLSINERALHCILNLMFATSCVASQAQPPLSRYQSSVEFFDRAQELMSYELMDIYNFEIIQILLLTAVYLQHEKMPQKCLRNISTAIHIAQELGLHMPETIESINDSRERGIARQVWNGCVIMDRIASMTFGFDLKIPQSVAKKGLNYLALNSVEVSSGAGRRSLPSKLNFYVSFCRLHYIIGEVLETFYYFVDSDIDRAASRNIAGERLGSSLSFDKYASLLKIESELCNWAQSLHPFFQMPSDLEDPTPTKHITREANVLRARPFLLQLHHQGAGSTPAFGLYSDDQIMQHVIFQCQVQCTKAARDMIEFIVRNLPEQKQAYLLPSYWYTVS